MDLLKTKQAQLKLAQSKIIKIVVNPSLIISFKNKVCVCFIYERSLEVKVTVMQICCVVSIGDFNCCLARINSG